MLDEIIVDFGNVNSYNVKPLKTLKQFLVSFVDETLYFVDENIFRFT